MNDETLLVISLGLCLGMVVTAVKTDFSAALGAFIMGSILAETIEAEHIEHIIKPVKDLFGAIFFVSVGMLVDPAILIEYAWPVVIITLVTIIGKAFFSSFGTLISGQPLKTSIQSGFSLAQIGEFAFIIASLGVSLGVMSEFIYPIIVAVSVITTFTTPYFIQLSDPFVAWLHKILPSRTIAFLSLFSSGAKTVNRESDWEKLVKTYLLRMSIYVVLLIAIIWLSLAYALPFITEKIPGIAGTIVSAVITLLLMSPFLMALVSNKSNSPELFMKLWNDNKYNRGRLVFLVLLRVFVAVMSVTFVLTHLFDFGYIVGIIIALAIMIFILIFRADFNRYQRLENRFLSNLNQREEEEKKRHPLSSSFRSQFKNKDIHIANLVVSPDSLCIGKTLKELNFRNDYGINIVKIIRGSRMIYIPESSECIYPYDKIAVVGTDEQIVSFSEQIESDYNSNSFIDIESNKEVVLQSLIIDEHFPYMEMSIRDSEIGKGDHCLVVGIERKGNAIANPKKSTILKQNDLVWMVVEKKKTKQ
jgi:CPA2 family monovalent cation:H+ antiporter-2